ncbi:hypothetical protein HF521_016990 [Silurus meridionalis]|uniref:Uncharacterized protein n=1 Tax=Silurus meridionalis TaxID=175797 RepID=A0A8T0BNN4_SILME|nr:hypothetical protein HF521_016990 [Silurus meridionalis]
MAPSCRHPGPPPKSGLGKQYRQFQLFSLATEIALSIEHLSRATVPENPCLSPRIVQSTFTRDMGTQTSSDLSAAFNQQTQTYDDDLDDGICFPATRPQFSPYPSRWSPTDYSPTSPVPLPDYLATLPSPDSEPKYSLISCAAAEAHKLFYPNKHA